MAAKFFQPSCLYLENQTMYTFECLNLLLKLIDILGENANDVPYDVIYSTNSIKEEYLWE